MTLIDNIAELCIVPSESDTNQHVAVRIWKNGDSDASLCQNGNYDGLTNNERYRFNFRTYCMYDFCEYNTTDCEDWTEEDYRRSAVDSEELHQKILEEIEEQLQEFGEVG